MEDKNEKLSTEVLKTKQKKKEMIKDVIDIFLHFISKFCL